MTVEEQRVAQAIRTAFCGVALGNGVGLLEAQGLDDYADDEQLKQYRANDERDDWTRFSVELLDSCHSSLSFFDALGMRFHLPAYLLNDLEGKSTQDVLFHLVYLNNDATSRFDALSAEQRAAVQQFLLLRLADPRREFVAPMIQQALQNYWKSPDT